MSTRRCPRCQSQWDPPARFCPRDGVPLVEVPSPALRGPRRTLPDIPPRPHTVPPPLTGRTIGDRYKVLRRLGEGGTSHVYLADDSVSGQQCAVKVLAPRISSDTGSKERLRREALFARQFSHPNVCPVLDVGELETGQLYLIMPYLRGETLHDSESRRGPYPVAEGIDMLRQLAAGLQHAHDLGVVHRDLKPENVMLVPDDSLEVGIRAIVMDFGLGKAFEAGDELVRLTQTGIVLGTPEFMSPEQVYGREVDGRADVFALGVLGFEMFTGELPFAGRNTQEMMLARLRGRARTIRSVRADLPVRLDGVFSRALAGSPRDRHPTMRAFSAALLEGVPGGFLSRWLKR